MFENIKIIILEKVVLAHSIVGVVFLKFGPMVYYIENDCYTTHYDISRNITLICVMILNSSLEYSSKMLFIQSFK